VGGLFITYLCVCVFFVYTQVSKHKIARIIIIHFCIFPYCLTEEAMKHEEALCNALVQQVSQNVERPLLVKFIRCFLLKYNSSSVRWQAHSLILHIYRSSTPEQQDALLDLLWALWPELPSYGRKAAQFVDLLGYFTIKTTNSAEGKVSFSRLLKLLWLGPSDDWASCSFVRKRRNVVTVSLKC